MKNRYLNTHSPQNGLWNLKRITWKIKEFER